MKKNIIIISALLLAAIGFVVYLNGQEKEDARTAFARRHTADSIEREIRMGNPPYFRTHPVNRALTKTEADSNLAYLSHMTMQELLEVKASSADQKLNAFVDQVIRYKDSVEGK